VAFAVEFVSTDDDAAKPTSASLIISDMKRRRLRWVPRPARGAGFSRGVGG
jgi:hypothetical protein